MSMIKTVHPWIYIAPDCEIMPLSPAEALILVPGNMRNNSWEKAITLFIKMSSHDIWCGVAKPYFRKEIYRTWKGDEAVFVEEAVEQMIEEGMLYVAENHNSWWSKNLYRQYNYIICPTFALLDWLWMRQLRKLPKATSF
jgi:hypothetical protein